MVARTASRPQPWLLIDPGALSHADFSAWLKGWQGQSPPAELLPSGLFRLKLSWESASSNFTHSDALLGKLWELLQKKTLPGLRLSLLLLPSSSLEPLTALRLHDPLVSRLQHPLLIHHTIVSDMQGTHPDHLPPEALHALPADPWCVWLPPALRPQRSTAETNTTDPHERDQLAFRAHPACQSWHWSSSGASALPAPSLRLRPILFDPGLLTTTSPRPFLLAGDQLELFIPEPPHVAQKLCLLFQPEHPSSEHPPLEEAGLNSALHRDVVRMLLPRRRQRLQPVVVCWHQPGEAGLELALPLAELAELHRQHPVTPEDARRWLAQRLLLQVHVRQLPLNSLAVLAYPMLELAGRLTEHEPLLLQQWRQAMQERNLAPLEPAQEDTAFWALSPAQQAVGQLLRAFVWRQHGRPEAASLLKALMEQAVDLPHASARAARELGRFLLDQGQPQEAERLLLQSIEQLEGLQDPLEAARARLHLGYLYAGRDRTEEALAVYQQLETPARQAQEPVLLANALEGQGQALHDLGRADEARQRYEEARALFEMLSDRAGQLRLFGDLSNLEYEYGTPEKAVQYAQEQLQLSQALGSEREQGCALLNVGRAYVAAQQLSEARTVLEQACTRLRTEGGARWALAQTYLAETCMEQGDPAAGLRWLTAVENALQNEDEGGDALQRMELVWQAARVRGRCLVGVGRTTEALTCFELGLEELERWRCSLTHPARAQAQEVWVRFQQDYLETMLMLNRPSEELWDALERTRARSFLEQNRAVRDLDALNPTGEARPIHNTHDYQHTTAHKTVYKHAGELDPTSSFTLWSFFCLKQQLLVCQRHSDGISHRLIPWAEAEVKALLDTLRLARLTYPLPAEVPGYLNRLSHHLLNPLSDWLESLRQASAPCLGLILHGLLHEVPWSALPWPRHSDEEVSRPHKVSPEVPPLGTVLGLFQAPSVAGLRQLSAYIRPTDAQQAGETQPLKPPRPLRILLMGDPTGDLPSAQQEVKRLSRLFHRPHVYTGAQADTGALLRHAGQVELIHLAMHSTQQGTHAPVLRLADGHFPQRKQLQAHARTDAMLSGVQLVVLSVCETLQGPLPRSMETPDRLPQQLLRVGAEAVLAAHWPLLDDGLGPFFEDFYQRVLQGERLADALREAQAKSWRTRSDEEAWLLGAGTLCLFGTGHTPLRMNERMNERTDERTN